MNEKIYADKAMDMAERIGQLMSELTTFIEKVNQNYTDDVHDLTTAHNRLFGASVRLIAFSRKTLDTAGQTNFDYDKFLERLLKHEEL